MNKYEEYLSEKLKIAESKIESLYYQLSIEEQDNDIMHIEMRRKVKEYKEELEKAYIIAYDLMPSGHCSPKIMDFASDLRNLKRLLDRERG